MSTNESITVTSPPRNQILEDAWLRFATYDKNAVIAQRRFVQQRKWILILGVAATTLAIVYSTLEQYLKPDTIVFPGWLGSWLSKQQFLEGFHVLVIAVPIIVTVLVAFSEKFKMGISWVMLRSSAEAIKKEIYRYRMQVDEYNPSETRSTETRDVRLAKRLKVISRRLMETSVNQTDLQAYKGDLPPRSGTPEEDNGFDDMTAEQYLKWRLENQFNYYQKKVARLGKELRRFQALIILLGGVGALLAAVNLNVWLAVSNALAVAFASYLEFKRIEATIVSCNLSAADLYDIRIWWHALSPETRRQRASVETLVSGTEAVLQTENAGWLQEMREALSEIYKDKKEIKPATANDELAPAVAAEKRPSHPEFQPHFLRETTTSEAAPTPANQTDTVADEAMADSDPGTMAKPDAEFSAGEDMSAPEALIEPLPDMAAIAEPSPESEPAA